MSVGVAAALVPGIAIAGGFQLLHQSQGGLGTAFAGSAALAEDASTGFFNPAGLAWLGGNDRKSGWNYVMGGAVIVPMIRFTDTGSTPASGTSQPLGGSGD